MGSELSTAVKMSKSAAETLHRAIGSSLTRAGREMGGMLLDMHNQKGYESLGCNTFESYLKKVEEDYGGSARSVYNWMGVVEVERALQAVNGSSPEPLSLRVAMALHPLLDQPTLLLEAYTKGAGSESRIKAVVERLMPPKAVSKKAKDKTGKGGWTKEDLESDTELKEALSKIQSVFGKEKREAIQNGILAMPKKDVLTLAKLYAPTMEKLEHLIFANRWPLAKSMAFLNDMPTDQSTVADLKNYCLTTKGLYWTGGFSGFEISVKATTAVKKKLE
jgi:hypothetical protein